MLEVVRTTGWLTSLLLHPRLSHMQSADHVLMVLPATREMADLQLEYLPPKLLNLSQEDLPENESWPLPGPHRPPFDKGLVDYCRAVGPDLWVGVGWKLDGRAPGERFPAFPPGQGGRGSR